MKKLFFLPFALIILFFLSAKPVKPDQIIGVWKSDGDGFLIKIDKIGNHFQGRIVRIESEEADRIIYDQNNPVEHLKKLPLKGNKIINKLAFDPASAKWAGIYYNYKDGKYYQCTVLFETDNQIKIITFAKNQPGKTERNWVRM